MSSPVLLPAGNPGPMTGSGTNTWLLDGPEPALIDAGTGTPLHLAALSEHLQGRPLSDVYVTHGHADHVSGISALKERWPTLRAHKWTGDQLAEAGWRGLTDGAHVQAGRRTLEVLHTPGHAEDHVCFWDSASRELFGGDMVITGSTVLIPAGHGGNLRAYLSSLERIAALDAVRIFPGHGPIIEPPATLLKAYLDHRRQRESQVRACLAHGVQDIEAIVARIYPHIPESVRDAARLTIAAHLEKLKEEGEYLMDFIHRWLLGLVTIGLAGTAADLLLLGHYEGPTQLIPLLLVAAGFGTIVWHLLARSAVSVLAFRSVMVLLVMGGLLGMVLHYRGNMEFQLETDPTAHGFALFMKVLHAKAPPALAPAALSQLGLLGLVYAYRHPALTPHSQQKTGAIPL